MGIGFYKDKDDTFALYSSYSDTFLYKGLSLKELIFFYMSEGSKISNLKNEYNYRLRDLNLEERSDSDKESYQKAEGFDLTKYFIDSISLYVMPLLVTDKEFVIYDSFEDTVGDTLLTKEEALSYLDSFYLEIFSKKYIESFIEMHSKTSYKETFRYNTMDRDKVKEMVAKIEKLTNK